MRKLQHIFFLAWLCLGGSGLAAQPLQPPSHYTLLEQAEGDLDKDGKPERAVVYNLPDSTDSLGGIPRELIIYKNTGNTWVIWQRSTSAILDSKSGGMMGDPFQEIEINNGVLSILQAGGSSWKWDRRDKYRFQNDRFELIGYTTEFGKHCEEWTTIDFNLSTGLIHARKSYERCDANGDSGKIYKQETEQFRYKLNNPILLGNRNQVEAKIVSPKYKFELYL